MKVINAKKLIASTLIFLFSSYNQAILADTFAPPVQIDSLAKAAPQIDLGAPSPLLLDQLYNLPAKASMPTVTPEPYGELKAAYVYQGEGFYPKIVARHGSPAHSLFMPAWPSGANMMSFGYMLFSFYLAFKGYEQMAGQEIHTTPLTDAPFQATVVQCLAAHLASIDRLVLHTQDGALLSTLQHYLKQHQGESMMANLHYLCRWR